LDGESCFPIPALFEFYNPFKSLRSVRVQRW
jgi:hypothetical protein